MNEITPNLSLPLPHQQNDLSEDVGRLRDAISMLDTIVAAKAGDAEIQAALLDIIGAAPGALDSLAELALSLGNNPDFAGYVATQITAINGLITALTTVVDGKADAAATTTALNLKATVTALNAEITARQEADIALQAQIADIPAQARLRAHFMSSN